jgi:hypothetical protein
MSVVTHVISVVKCVALNPFCGASLQAKPTGMIFDKLFVKTDDYFQLSKYSYLTYGHYASSKSATVQISVRRMITG